MIAQSWHDWQWSTFVAGFVGGAAGLLVGQPLDTVKVILQQRYAGSDNEGEEAALLATDREASSGVWALLVERPTSAFAGLVPPLLSLGFMNAILFWAFAATTLIIAPTQGQRPLALSFVAGCVAGLAGCIVSIPTEYLKVRQQVRASLRTDDAEQYDRDTEDDDLASTREIRSTTRKSILRKWSRTVSRVWRFGGLATILRDTIGYGVWFLTYDAVLAAVGVRRREHAAYVLLAGGAAGVAGWGVIYPLDTVKTRQQANATNRSPVHVSGSIDGGDVDSLSTTTTESSAKARTRRAPVYSSIVRTTAHILERDGVQALFAGFWACMARAFVADAVTFYVVRYVERLLG